MGVLHVRKWFLSVYLSQEMVSSNGDGPEAKTPQTQTPQLIY